VCAAFGVAGFIGCYPRPNFAHIAAAAPLALPLIAYCIARLTQNSRPLFRYFLAADMVVLCIPKAIAYGLLVALTLRTEVVATPRGGVRFVDLPDVPETLARIEATPPADAYFFYPFMMMMPFLSARPQVSKYDVLVPYLNLPSQYRDACLSVLRQASWVVLDRNDFSNLKQSYPKMPGSRPEETVRFERVLDSAFEFVSQEGSFELRRRATGVDDKMCDDIVK
jgi:hypothetical protein